MTKGELKELVSLKIKGENSKFEVGDLIIKEALSDVLRHSEPSELLLDYDAENPPSDIFRLIQGDKYIPVPNVPTQDTERIEIDEELAMSVVNFVCSYATYKSRDRYEAKAKEICAIYNTNQTYLEEE